MDGPAGRHAHRPHPHTGFPHLGHDCSGGLVQQKERSPGIGHEKTRWRGKTQTKDQISSICKIYFWAVLNGPLIAQ